MENIENVVMNGEVMTEMPTDMVDSSLGKAIAKGVVTVALVGLGIKGAILLGKKVKNAFAAKKAKKTEVVVEDYEEVPCEEA